MHNNLHGNKLESSGWVLHRPAVFEKPSKQVGFKSFLRPNHADAIRRVSRRHPGRKLRQARQAERWVARAAKVLARLDRQQAFKLFRLKHIYQIMVKYLAQ